MRKRRLSFTNIAVLGGGSPPPPAAPAVTFAIDTVMTNAAFGLGASVTACSIFAWAKAGDINSSINFLIPDVGGSNQAMVTWTAIGGGIWNISFATSLTDATFNDAVGFQGSGSYDLSSYVPVLMSFDWSDFGNLKYAIYVLDTLDAATPFTQGSTGPMWGDGTQWDFRSNDGSSFCDLSTFWFAPISLLDGTGLAISSANRRMFTTVDNKWLDPSGFPAGGQVLFNGDATTYATNQGTAGAFTVSGTALVDAPTGPPT